MLRRVWTLVKMDCVRYSGSSQGCPLTHLQADTLSHRETAARLKLGQATLKRVLGVA